MRTSQKHYAIGYTQQSGLEGWYNGEAGAVAHQHEGVLAELGRGTRVEYQGMLQIRPKVCEGSLHMFILMSSKFTHASILGESH